MNNAAIEFIGAIASNMAEVNKPLSEILYALEDGEALMYLGVSNSKADRELVEDAYSTVYEWLREGRKFL